MKLKQRRIFLAWQHEKEEQWLNEMSKQGYQLAKVDFINYQFEEDHRHSFEHQLVYVGEKYSDDQALDSQVFSKDEHVEHVLTANGWAYLRRNADLGKFELYADIASKVKNYSNVMTIVVNMGVANLLVVISNLLNLLGLSVYMIIGQAIICLFVLFIVIQLSIRINKLKKGRRYLE